MAEYTNIASQTVAVNGNVLFSDENSCGCISHREGSGLFTLHGGKKYIVIFSANITGATAETEVDLAFSVSGEPILATQIASVPVVANAMNNVSTAYIFDVPCGCCYTISVKNVGTTANVVENANLIIKREA